MPPSRAFALVQLVIRTCGDVLQHTHGFARDFRADAVARQNQNVEIHILVGRPSGREISRHFARRWRRSLRPQPFLRSAAAVKRWYTASSSSCERSKPRSSQRSFSACRPLCLPSTSLLSGTPTVFGSMIS